MPLPGVMRTVSPSPRSYPLSSLRCNSHCTQYRAAPGSSCNILINWQFNKYNLEVTKCFLKSHKTAVDSSYPKCGAPKFDGKLFLTLDNNILLSSPMFPHCCCPSYRGHLLVAGINFTWEQECGLWTTGVSSGDLNGGQFVSIM